MGTQGWGTWRCKDIHREEGQGHDNRPHGGVYAGRGLQEPDLRASERGAAGGQGRPDRCDDGLRHGAVSEVVARPTHGGGGSRATELQWHGPANADAVAASCSHAIHSEASERLLVLVLHQLEAPELGHSSAHRLEIKGDACLGGGRLRVRAERIEDKASVGLIPGCSIGDEQEGGGSPDREEAL